MADATQVAEKGLKGYRIYSDNLHLHGALALTLAPNGNLICSNNDVINVVGGASRVNWRSSPAVAYLWPITPWAPISVARSD